MKRGSRPSRSRVSLGRGLLLSVVLHGLVVFSAVFVANQPWVRPEQAVRLRVELFGMIAERQQQGQERVEEEIEPVPEAPEPVPVAPVPDEKGVNPVRVEKKPPLARDSKQSRTAMEGRTQRTIRSSQQEDAQRRYLAGIVRSIQSKLTYPEEARALGQVGTPAVRFYLEADGRVAASSISIYRSSGYPSLDRQAVRAIQESAPFPPPPKAMVIIVDISFAERI